MRGLLKIAFHRSHAILSASCIFLRETCYFCISEVLLVVNAHDANAISAFVLDEQSKGIVQSQEELQVT